MNIKNKKDMIQFKKTDDKVKRIIKQRTIKKEEPYKLFKKNKVYKNIIEEVKEAFIDSYKESKNSIETKQLFKILDEAYNMVNDNNNIIMKEYRIRLNEMNEETNNKQWYEYYESTQHRTGIEKLYQRA